MICLKNHSQIDKMRESGRILHEVQENLKDFVKPGVTTGEVDALAEKLIRQLGGIPSELGYMGYPASICASVDDEVVHGIPSKHVMLKEGSIISIDVTLALDGWQADSAFTAPVGSIGPEKERLIRVTEECFWKGAAMALSGNRIG